jgi:predicted nucleic acid-binding protein
MFCDTSTLVKYYVNEVESDVVRARIDEAEEVTLSSLARVEVMSVFHRYWRERLWSREQFLRAVERFEQDDLSGALSWVPLNESIVAYSANIYTRLPDDMLPRASDCLHISTALHSNYREFHTHDLRQAKVAEALGLIAVRIA